MKRLENELMVAREQLLTLYKPSPDRCRPYVIEGGMVNEECLLTFDEGVLACMLAGYKQVGMVNFARDELLAQMAAHFGITCVGDISFTQQGAAQAQILIQAKEHGQTELLDGNNHYFYGYVLGYSEADILGFYDWLFDQDKRDAMAWLENQKSIGIQERAQLLEKARAGNLNFIVKKTVQTRTEIPYLVAYLTGMPEHEIKQAYRERARQRFDQDKTQVLDWIAHTLPKIG